MKLAYLFIFLSLLDRIQSTHVVPFNEFCESIIRLEVAFVHGMCRNRVSDFHKRTLRHKIRNLVGRQCF